VSQPKSQLDLDLQASIPSEPWRVTRVQQANQVIPAPRWVLRRLSTLVAALSSLTTRMDPRGQIVTVSFGPAGPASMLSLRHVHLTGEGAGSLPKERLQTILLSDGGDQALPAKIDSDPWTS